MAGILSIGMVFIGAVIGTGLYKQSTIGLIITGLSTLIIIAMLIAFAVSKPARYDFTGAVSFTRRQCWKRQVSSILLISLNTTLWKEILTVTLIAVRIISTLRTSHGNLVLNAMCTGYARHLLIILMIQASLAMSRQY